MQIRWNSKILTEDIAFSTCKPFAINAISVDVQRLFWATCANNTDRDRRKAACGGRQKSARSGHTYLWQTGFHLGLAKNAPIHNVTEPSPHFRNAVSLKAVRSRQNAMKADDSDGELI